MRIVGVDGADYRLAREQVDVNHLKQDVGTLHTIPSWATMFDRTGTRYERPDRYDRPLRADYIWNDARDRWTVANLPIMMPTYSFNCRVPRELSKPGSHVEREHERLALSRILAQADTEHVLVVLNGLDALSHRMSDMDAVRATYEVVFRWVKGHDPDVILSDHGFADFGGQSGVADHSPHAIVAGLDVEAVTDVGPALYDRVQ